MDLKTKIGLIFEGEQTVEGEKRRGEEEKEEEEGGAKKGMETNLEHGIVWSYGILRFCMINSLSPNLGF